jgi:hypothetical protein
MLMIERGRGALCDGPLNSDSPHCDDAHGDRIPRQVPDSVWKQPPVWWGPQRDSRTLVYATAGFPYEGRGSDGDHYLLIENDVTHDVYAFFKSRF